MRQRLTRARLTDNERDAPRQPPDQATLARTPRVASAAGAEPLAGRLLRRAGIASRGRPRVRPLRRAHVVSCADRRRRRAAHADPRRRHGRAPRDRTCSPVRRLTARCCSRHLHWDHTMGLPFFSAGDRDDARVTVILPEQENGADAATVLGGLMRPPYFPVGPTELRGQWSCQSIAPGECEIEGFAVLAREIPHKGGRTFGYRVSDGHSTIAYMPDHNPTALGPGEDGFGEYHAGGAGARARRRPARARRAAAAARAGRRGRLRPRRGRLPGRARRARGRARGGAVPPPAQPHRRCSSTSSPRAWRATRRRSASRPRASCSHL